MTSQRTRSPQTHPSQLVDPQDAQDPHESPNPVLAQAAGYANAARKARESCATGQDAVTELEARKNRPGQ